MFIAFLVDPRIEQNDIEVSEGSRIRLEDEDLEDNMRVTSGKADPMQIFERRMKYSLQLPRLYFLG